MAIGVKFPVGVLTIGHTAQAGHCPAPVPGMQVGVPVAIQVIQAVIGMPSLNPSPTANEADGQVNADISQVVCPREVHTAAPVFSKIAQFVVFMNQLPTLPRAFAGAAVPVKTVAVGGMVTSLNANPSRHEHDVAPTRTPLILFSRRLLAADWQGRQLLVLVFQKKNGRDGSGVPTAGHATQPDLDAFTNSPEGQVIHWLPFQYLNSFSTHSVQVS